MARIHPPGVALLSIVDTIANLAAPTPAELNAGDDLTEFARGMPNIPETGNTADISNLSSKFNARQGASYGGDTATAEFYRDDATDTAYTTMTRGKQTHLVLARDGVATPGTFAIGDKVWVYPITIISRAAGVPGRDEVEFFVSSMAITADATEGYTLA